MGVRWTDAEIQWEVSGDLIPIRELGDGAGVWLEKIKWELPVKQKPRTRQWRILKKKEKVGRKLDPRTGFRRKGRELRLGEVKKCMMRGET